MGPGPVPSPFATPPHPLARAAADELLAELRAGLAGGEGKMFGVLVAEAADGARVVLRAFSGMLGGAWTQPGFAPPLFDPAAWEAMWPAGQASLRGHELALRAIEEDPARAERRSELARLEGMRVAQSEALRVRHRERKAARRIARDAGGLDAAALHALDQESRADTAERRRFDAELRLSDNGVGPHSRTGSASDLQSRADRALRSAAAVPRIFNRRYEVTEQRLGRTDPDQAALHALDRESDTETAERRRFDAELRSATAVPRILNRRHGDTEQRLVSAEPNQTSDLLRNFVSPVKSSGTEAGSTEAGSTDASSTEVGGESHIDAAVSDRRTRNADRRTRNGLGAHFLDGDRTAGFDAEPRPSTAVPRILNRRQEDTERKDASSAEPPESSSLLRDFLSPVNSSGTETDGTDAGGTEAAHSASDDAAVSDRRTRNGLGAHLLDGDRTAGFDAEPRPSTAVPRILNRRQEDTERKDASSAEPLESSSLLRDFLSPVNSSGTGSTDAGGTEAAHSASDDAAVSDRRTRNGLGAPFLDGDRTDGFDAAAYVALAAQVAADDAERAAIEARRAEESRGLMKQVHDSYVIASYRGERRALRDLFAPGEPPGGAGDCAGPKLLGEAYRRGLRPIAMAEVWWGPPPATGGRHEGGFYPACRGKCGPILPFMLEGLEVEPPPVFGAAVIAADQPRPVFEDDDIVVVDKPIDLLSVPGRSGALRDSVQTRLRARYPAATGPLVVHRLDLETSGLLLAAKSEEMYAALQAQFARREIDKRYIAWLAGEVRGERGLIELALRVDLDDRPRQIVDAVHGKPAITEWSVLAREGGRTRVAFVPRTGRTHQIRVHAAVGLGAPIVGDRLYGTAGDRLLLHAERLELAHPRTGQRIAVESPAPW